MAAFFLIRCSAIVTGLFMRLMMLRENQITMLLKVKDIMRTMTTQGNSAEDNLKCENYREGELNDFTHGMNNLYSCT